MIRDELRNLFQDIGFEKYHKAVLNPKNFNLFEVLRYADYEIRHSNILAWLLQPESSHGIHTVFIEKFIMLLNQKADVDILPKKFDFRDSNLLIERELDHVDITIFLEKEKTLFAIENKTGKKSSEHYKQVERYKRELSKKYKNKYNIFAVLLTASREHIGSEKYNVIHISWLELYEVIKLIYQDKKFHFPEVRAFIRQYLTTIEKKIIQKVDPEFGKNYFQKLLIAHNPLIKKLSEKQEVEEDADSIKMEVPYRFRNTLERLVETYNQIPIQLRSEVREYMDNKDFRTDIYGRGRVHSIYFKSQNMANILKELSIDRYLPWSLTFSHHKIKLDLYFYPPTKENRPTINKIKEFIKQNPIDSSQPEKYAVRKEYDYSFIYQNHLCSKEELSTLLPLEIKKIVFDKLTNFFNSDHFVIEKYFKNNLSKIKAYCKEI